MFLLTCLISLTLCLSVCIYVYISLLKTYQNYNESDIDRFGYQVQNAKSKCDCIRKLRTIPLTL